MPNGRRCMTVFKDGLCIPWDPLHDDTQLMAIMKRFQLWEAIRDGSLVIGNDVNRSVVDFVAKMPPR
jgi:hypothetical protein